MTQTKTDTPLMQQYRAVKAAYPHAILFFRLGDFYEMFGEDAKTASRALGLVLTARQGEPMCGIPFHSSTGYIAKLIKAGHKVAVCEQTEDAGQGRKLVRREVVRLITPGTVLEDELLDAKTANYMICLETELNGWGAACVEVSTGEFWGTQKMNDPAYRGLASFLARLAPAEIIASGKTAARLGAAGVLPHTAALTVYDRPAAQLAPGEGWPARDIWANRQLALKAALGAAAYVEENEPHLKGRLAPVFKETADTLELDENAIRTLELVASDCGRAQSLWGALDRCVTPMGSRTLREWLLHPLADITAIKKRQKTVAGFVAGPEERAELAAVLENISDIERVLGRLAAASATPRDVAGLRRSLAGLEEFKKWFERSSCVGLETLRRFEDVYPALAKTALLLERAIVEAPPAKISDGGVMADGYHPELDELRALRRDGGARLRDFEARERERAKIPSLKVGYNSVFGYYIEITRANQDKAPQDYIRKQTLANCERYINEELKDMEARILGAEDRILRLESELFVRLREELAGTDRELRVFARIAAELDVYYAFAVVAAENGYVCPEVDLSCDLEIEAGRHPVVERNLPPGTFVPNNLYINDRDPQIMVITGPNMSGKSVYLRQGAVLVIMAQAGGFVPAKRARIGLVDRIMTRIGAHDALARGESTFMVEMKETASILASFSRRSLILLDEIGRGTSTFDGISIAWAVLEHLRNPEGGPKVLFATHYFELTDLEEKYPGVANHNVAVREWQNAAGRDEVIFLHKIEKGPADKSYGIHVAGLAGLPASCILRAGRILETLETRSELVTEKQKAAPRLPLFASHPVLDELRLVVPEKLSPFEALGLIHQWKKQLEN
ncbi:MAG: DNA mismatch repair protein MutS [Elusimicrobiaceae bacterium]|nr:DNA mismatch repair protein MutS [Elusimicrobiaceae bacterium]